MRNETLRYLGFLTDSPVDDRTNLLIDESLRIVALLSQFQYLYAEEKMSNPLIQELLAHPAYQSYLSGADEVLLVATTLGVQVDRYLKRLQVSDMTAAVVFDAAASAFLESKADEYERSLPYKSLGYRFCPGYGETPLSDIRTIGDRLKVQRIGITFLHSNLMVPMKSMIGLLRIGGTQEKNCDNCIAKPNCFYRKRGIRCYQ